MNFKDIKSQPLFQNMASLSLLQMANYIIPIIIIPFVSRALGEDYFGKATYAQNIITYLTVLVNYGFEFSATQDIAINKDDKVKIKSIFWSVISFKAVLLFVSFLCLFLLYFIFYKVHDDFLLYFFAALINVGFVLFPTWFFQGIEKMARMAIFNFSIKTLGAVLIIFIVQRPEDYRFYLLLLSLSYIFVGAVTLFYVIRKFNLLPVSIDGNVFNGVVKKGFPIFVNNVFSTLYTVAGMTILGLYVSDRELGIYAGAYKIIMAFVLINVPIATALFPVISKKFNESFSSGWHFFRMWFRNVILLGIFLTIIVYLFAPFFVKIFLGPGYEGAVDILRLYSPLPLLVMMASMCTYQGLYGLQLPNYAPLVGAIVGIFCVTVNFIFIPKYGLYSAVICYLISELLEVILSFSIVMSYKRKKRFN